MECDICDVFFILAVNYFFTEYILSSVNETLLMYLPIIIVRLQQMIKV